MSDLFIRIDINLNFLCHYPNCAFFQCNNTGHGLLTIDAVNAYNIQRGEETHIYKKYYNKNGNFYFRVPPEAPFYWKLL